MPIVVALVVFSLMVTWRRGRTLLVRHTTDAAPERARFFQDAEARGVPRVPGTGVFLTAQATGVPASLVHYLRHVHALPERIVLLRVALDHAPRVPIADSVTVDEEEPGFYRVTVRAGFMEHPCLPQRLCEAPPTCKLGLDAPDVTYFIGRETFLATAQGEMGPFAESLFSFLYKVASSATSYFGLPPDRVMEVGMHIDL